ncbi:MAG TPA: FmdB family zinc ribbon protein [Treponemataceae bacterium]|nr:FmdB family zinc ribbon protein [Treponemataceae bacterium]
MPTYEYACDTCGNSFEAVQKMADAPLSTCPECGKDVRRVLSGGIGIVFKGSGFYVNDSAAKPAKSENPSKSDKPAKTPTPASV